MQNEIIIGQKGPGTVGNMYCGAIANKALWDKEMQKSLDSIYESLESKSTENTAWVFEYVDGEFVLRAGQKTTGGAMHYMNANSVLVHRSNVKQNDDSLDAA